MRRDFVEATEADVREGELVFERVRDCHTHTRAHTHTHTHTTHTHTHLTHTHIHTHMRACVRVQKRGMEVKWVRRSR